MPIRRPLLLISFFLFMTKALMAQDAVLFGNVKDSLNKSLYGATVAVFGKPIGTFTDEKGNYSLVIPAGERLKIVVSFTGSKSDTISIQLAPGERKEMNRILRGNVYEFKGVNIEERSLKTINVTPINPKNVSMIPTPNQNVEDLLKTLPGVSSANELSSTYSVRGGNYDENLVYINDFEVYRPLLVRSGQQ